MKWSILILTQLARREYLARLLKLLAPQLHGKKREIGLAIKLFDPFLSLGANRQALVDGSHGEYVSFIDDDDLVAIDYVNKILPMLDGVDYVGFKLQYFQDGVPAKPTFHSLKHVAGWSEDENGYYRDISHVNPIRRELARLTRFEGGYGEDHRWADRLRELDVVKTERYIDEFMYLYYCRTNKEEKLAAAG